jgi:hypothetical protein
MALNPIYIPERQKRGGGLFGKIAGGLAGLAAGVAAPFTGGASLAAIPGLMAAGSTVGGIAGEAISPSKASPGGGGNPVLETAMQADPMAQMAMLSESQNSLKGYPLPTDQAQEAWDYYERAKQDLRKRMNLGSHTNLA